jgi:hypothetical protein
MGVRGSMGVRGYGVVSENGDHIEGASEDALFEMISALDGTDNTFIVIEPDTDDPAWFASVAVLEEGGYEIVRSDSARHEHKVHTELASAASHLTSSPGWLHATLQVSQPDGAPTSNTT